jgi:hypothetical protein
MDEPTRMLYDAAGPIQKAEMLECQEESLKKGETVSDAKTCWQRSAVVLACGGEAQDYEFAAIMTTGDRITFASAKVCVDRDCDRITLYEGTVQAEATDARRHFDRLDVHAGRVAWVSAQRR